jgi:hypothetical protein
MECPVPTADQAATVRSISAGSSSRHSTHEHVVETFAAKRTFPEALSSSTVCRFIPGHWVSPIVAVQ